MSKANYGWWSDVLNVRRWHATYVAAERRVNRAAHILLPDDGIWCVRTAERAEKCDCTCCLRERLAEARP